MPVLELAYLRLLPGTEISSRDFLAHFKHAQQTMDMAFKTGLTFQFFHCIDDPALVYLIGNWASVKQHMEEFIPSQADQYLLRLLKDQISVEWMFHVDLVEPALAKYSSILEQPVVAIDRSIPKLPNDELEKYDRLGMAVKFHTKSYVATREHFMCG